MSFAINSFIVLVLFRNIVKGYQTTKAYKAEKYGYEIKTKHRVWQKIMLKKK